MLIGINLSELCKIYTPLDIFQKTSNDVDENQNLVITDKYIYDKDYLTKIYLNYSDNDPHIINQKDHIDAENIRNIPLALSPKTNKGICEGLQIIINMSNNFIITKGSAIINGVVIVIPNDIEISITENSLEQYSELNTGDYNLVIVYKFDRNNSENTIDDDPYNGPYFDLIKHSEFMNNKYYEKSSILNLGVLHILYDWILEQGILNFNNYEVHKSAVIVSGDPITFTEYEVHKSAVIVSGGPITFTEYEVQAS